MGYVFLALSLFCGATKGYCGKITSGFIKSNNDNWLISLVRMIFCVIIGLIFVVVQDGAQALKVNVSALLVSLLAGVSTAGFVISWIRSVQKGAYMMVDVFLMLGVVVPTIACKVFFGEELRVNQIIGFLFLLGATYIMCTYNVSIKGKMSGSSLLLLAFCGFSNGITDFSQKLFLYTNPDVSIGVFNLYTYVFAAVVLFIMFIFGSKQQERTEPKELLKKTVGYIAVLALCLFLYSYFKIQAAKFIPSAELYPMAQGIALMLSMGMSALFFKEKLTPKCIGGVALAFVGLLIINLL